MMPAVKNETVRRAAPAARRRRAYKTCSFTGHRPQKLGFAENDPRCDDFKRRLTETLQDLIGQGYVLFVSGGAMGFDMYAAEAVLDLKAQYPWIMLEMVSPYDAQAERWPEALRARREALLRRADIVTATGHDFDRGCLMRRNRYLVDRADLLLAAYNGQPGGTAMTIDMARRRGVTVQTLDPRGPASAKMSIVD